MGIGSTANAGHVGLAWQRPSTTEALEYLVLSFDTKFIGSQREQK